MKQKSKIVKIKGHWLTIANYKEPLLAVPEKEGFGYMGTLLCTPKGDLVQCHICGELLKELPGHIFMKHKMKARDYKKKFLLSPRTALLSETVRRQKVKTYVAWMATLSPEQKAEYRARQFKKWKEWNRNRPEQAPHKSLEFHNKKGTCPDQVLAKLKEIVEELGHRPSQDEMLKSKEYNRWFYLARVRFGTLNEAWKLLKIPVQDPHPRGMPKYSDEMLLGLLKAYNKRYKKVPTWSDFKRGILPARNTYLNHFGSIDNARFKAGLPYWGNSKETKISAIKKPVVRRRVLGSINAV